MVGRLSARSYDDKSGQKRTKVEVIADDVKFLGGRDEQAPQSSEGSYTGEKTGSYNNDQFYSGNTTTSKDSGGYDYE